MRHRHDADVEFRCEVADILRAISQRTDDAQARRFAERLETLGARAGLQGVFGVRFGHREWPSDDVIIMISSMQEHYQIIGSNSLSFN